MEHHPLQWTAPSPTWPALTGAIDPDVRRGFNRPSLLRFASDSFMEDFRSMLDIDPMRLGEFAARPETWRGVIPLVAPTPAAPVFARALQRKRLASLRRASPPAGAATPAASTGGQPPVLKLYQPAHQRFYLVIANLVCQFPGLPDHTIQAGTEEKATFVLRRLLPKAGVTRPTADPATADEYAFVADSGGQGWRQVIGPTGGAAVVVAGEDQLALFHAAYTTEEGRRRKVLAGLVPVARRDAYLGAASRDDQPSGMAAASSPPPPPDPRFTLLQKQVTHPWRQLTARAAAAEAIQRAAHEVKESEAPSQDDREIARKEARQGIQVSSWYVLLDFARFLQAHLPNVWAGIVGTAQSPSAADTALINAIAGTTYVRDGTSRTMSSMLVAIRARDTQLDSVATPYVEGSSAWPSELFPLGTVRSTDVLFAPKPGASARSPIESVSGLTPQTLEPLVLAALPSVATAALPAAAVARLPLAPADPGWFVIRCVYERPACGPFVTTVVSEPTEVFQLAGFFDPDAPSRPIRIGLPLDVSPAGLSKFDKNTGFMVSDVLCGMMERVKGLSLGDLVLSVLPWPFYKPLPSPEQAPCPDGRMLILSIPILTICALILAIIIVAVLNTLFFWIPLFIVEIVVPGLKAKREAT